MHGHAALTWLFVLVLRQYTKMMELVDGKLNMKHPTNLNRH